MHPRLRPVRAAFIALLLALPGALSAGDKGGGPGSSGRGGGGTAGAATADPMGPPGEGTAKVSWTAPVRRKGGQCLDELGGFVVKWGPMRDRLDRQERLTPQEANCKPTGESTPCGPQLACQHTVDKLGPIKWYFAVQAIDGAGKRSPDSRTVFLNVD